MLNRALQWTIQFRPFQFESHDARKTSKEWVRKCTKKNLIAPNHHETDIIAVTLVQKMLKFTGLPK